MIIYQICLYLLPFFPYLPALLMDLHDDVGCSQTGHVGSGFGTCRRARGARRIVSACARLFILCPLPSFFRLCVCGQPHITNNHRKMTIFRCVLHVILPTTHLFFSPYRFPRLWLTLSGFISFTGKSWSLKKSCASSVTTSSPWKCLKRRYFTRFRDIFHSF